MHLIARNQGDESESGREGRGSTDLLKALASSLSLAAQLLETGTVQDLEGEVNFYDEVRRFEIALIKKALRKAGGSQAQAARLLGLKPSTLCTMIKRYQIPW